MPDFVLATGILNVIRPTVLLFCIAILMTATRPRTASAVEIAPLRHSVDVAGGAFVPFAASHPLTKPDRNITRLLMAIHSSGFDALQYYENSRKAASKVPGALAETLVIAPQFFEQSVIPGPIPDGLLFWRVSPYRGSGRGAVGPAVMHVPLSAYAVVDDWLAELTKGELFPGLKEIVLVGHSAGGQFVQRYAMVGKFKPPAAIKIRYVVSAPSSYAYPSNERYHQGRKRFVVPDANTLNKCPGYNNWGYGLGAPYGYFADADLNAIAKEYAGKTVFYLCGSRDADPNDGSIGKSCGAMMQGMHRLQRMQVFKAFLEFKYGKSVSRRHKFAVVPNVGHFGLGTMTSAAGLKALFGPDL